MTPKEQADELPPDPLGDFFESQGIKVVDCTPSPSKCTHSHCDLPDGHAPLHPVTSQAEELLDGLRKIRIKCVNSRGDLPRSMFYDGALAYFISNAIQKAREEAEIDARIDELKRLWNTTQPDTIPAGTKALDMSSELHRRIAELKAKQEVSK